MTFGKYLRILQGTNGVLKANGQTECDKERAPPSKIATQTKKLSINTLTKNTDGTAADGILTNERS